MAWVEAVLYGSCLHIRRVASEWFARIHQQVQVPAPRIIVALWDLHDTGMHYLVYTQLAKMSFDEISDLTAGWSVFSFFIIYAD